MRSKMAYSLFWSVNPILILGVVLFLNSYILSTSGKEIASEEIKRISAAEWEKALNEHPELKEVARIADNGEFHPYVHSRNRRTIGRVFDMFRGLFDRIFGGKKGGGGGGGYGAPQKKPAASYGPPTKPPSGYGPPKSPKKPSYGRQKQRKPKPGYGAPGPKPRPPQPRPPRPRPPPSRPLPPSPPRPRPQRPQAPIQPGYGGPRPSRPVSGGYGGPQIPNQPNYGSQQQQQQSNDLDGYGSPQAPVVGGGDIDGYGSPQAPVVGGGDIDGYGAPQAPVVGGGDIDGYGSPQAPVVDGGNIDGYGAPQAPVVGGGGIRNSGQYGAPTAPVGPVRQPTYGSAPQPNYGSSQQQFRGAPQPSIGPSIQLSVGAPFPAAPINNNAIPTSASLADSVFRMIPAPNLATGRPPTEGGAIAQGNQDSYGSPQGQVIGSGSTAIRGNAQANQDSYGSPQGPVIGNGDTRQAGNSYGSPQAPRVTSSSAGNSYGSPVAPTSSSNPFISSSAPPLSVYTSQATFPAQNSGNIIIGAGKAQAPSSDINIITVGNGASASSGLSNVDSYGSPVGPGPITDIDLPSVIPGAIQPGVEPRTEAEAAVAPKDVYGSPVAPVGTSAPVPQDVLKQIENNLPEFDNEVFPTGNDIVPEGELVSTVIEEDSQNDDVNVEYDEIEEEVIDELVDKIQQELDDPNLIKDPEDEKFLNEVITNLKNTKEVVNTIEYIDPTTGSGVSAEGSGEESQDSYGSPSDVDDRGNSVDDQPLFDNVRDVVADPPATGTPGPTIDLAGGGFVDFSNGVLDGNSESQSTASEINLTGTTTPTVIIEELTTEAPETRDYQDSYGSQTTVQPIYEDIDDLVYDSDDGSRSAGQEYDDVVEDESEEYADIVEDEIEEEGNTDDVYQEDEYEDSDEGVQGYDIRPPEKPLDSSLSGIF